MEEKRGKKLVGETFEDGHILIMECKNFQIGAAYRFPHSGVQVLLDKIDCILQNTTATSLSSLILT